MPTFVFHTVAHWRRRVVATCQRLGWFSEDGQSLVMATICILAMLFVAALLVDGGMAYTQRRVAQNAADAAAFAGARRLATGGNDHQVQVTLQEYAVTRNGAKSYTATYIPGGEPVGHGSVPSGAQGVAVQAQTNFATFFARVMGRSQMTVVADAKATFGGVNNPGPNVQPLARFCAQPSLPDCDFVVGQTYDIWESDIPGNFGWLSWNGSTNTPYIIKELTPGNQTDYEDPHGACSELAVGCWVQGLPGVGNGSGVRDALDWWVHHADQPMIIIVYDQMEGSGANANYRISGFAAFDLQSYDLPQGNGHGDGYVRGKFVNWVTSAPVDEDTPNYGLVSVHLTH